MTTLVTNDDGIDSPGLHLLVRTLADLGQRVYVVAPSRCHSAESMNITVGEALEVETRDVPGSVFAAAVSGTPVDCVKLARTALELPPFELLVSGINYGLNVARDLLYSGTVGAALEGADCALPAIAISAERSPEGDVIYDQAAALLQHNFDAIWSRIHQRDWRLFANLNVPVTPTRGTRWTRVSKGSYFLDGYEKTEQGYILNGPRSLAETDIDTDLGAIEAGYSSISIIRHHWQSD